MDSLKRTNVQDLQVRLTLNMLKRGLKSNYDGLNRYNNNVCGQFGIPRYSSPLSLLCIGFLSPS